MFKKIIEKRTRFFISSEGQGEQSFITWLQRLADRNKLNIYLDFLLLRGGGYKTMLKQTIKHWKFKEKNEAVIMLVDADRADNNDDGWSLDQLQKKADRHNIELCLQHPNQEGFLLRMFPGKENLQLDNIKVGKLLKKEWPGYQKPVDAYTLDKKFTVSDLLRAANGDPGIKKLLSMIKLIKNA